MTTFNVGDRVIDPCEGIGTVIDVSFVGGKARHRVTAYFEKRGRELSFPAAMAARDLSLVATQEMR